MNQELIDSPLQDQEADFSHSFGSYFPLPMQGLGVVLMVGGLYLLLTLNLFGILMFATGITFVFAKKETGFNFSSGAYKEYFRLFKYKSGTWKTLPLCEYISVFGAAESQVVNVESLSSTINNRVIVVNLIHSHNQRLAAFKTDNKDEAFKVAHLFSEKLNLDILDATNYEKSWITRDGK